MPLIEEKFDQGRIDSIKRYLQREAGKGKAKDFEIIIDGIKVVSRTNDTDEFDEYEEELRDTSRSISFLVYDGAGSNRNTRYAFYLKEGPPLQAANGLDGIDSLVTQRLEEREREHELQRVREKLEATREQLKEAEEFAEELQQENEQLKTKRLADTLSLGELVGSAFKGLLRQNASKNPAIQALAGFLGVEAPEDQLPAVPPAMDVAASFEKQDGKTELSEDMRNRLALIAQMQERFNEQQMIAVFTILDALAGNPEKIEVVLQCLGLQPVAR